jgi:hypothetical protein
VVVEVTTQVNGADDRRTFIPEVTGTGATTTVTVPRSAPAPAPSGYQFGNPPLQFDISTTATSAAK